MKPGAVDVPSDYGMVDPLPFHPVYDYSYDGIMRSFEDGLQRLGLDYIDILLVHDIGKFQHGDENERHLKDLSNSGFKAMDELKNNGVIKAIGLGVNENQVCLDALEIGYWDVFLLVTVEGEASSGKELVTFTQLGAKRKILSPTLS